MCGFCSASLSWKAAAEGLVGDHEEHRPAAERAHVVGEDLALPPRVEQILPALRLLGGLHHLGIDEDVVGDHVDGHAGSVGLERRHGPARVRQHPVRHEDALRELELRGRRAVVGDVAEHLARRLLRPDALAQLARPRLQHLHPDSVLRLEGGGDLRGHRIAHRPAVHHDLALLLGRVDDLLPLITGCLRGGEPRGQSHWSECRQAQNRSACQHAMPPP
jgi:hypothetical protein